MMEQDTLPLWAAARPWQNRKLFDSPTLQALQEANSSCLEVLLRAHLQAFAGATRSPVPDSIAAFLIGLDAEQRSRVARCPFSLFSARFNDGPFWQTLLHARRMKDAGQAPDYSEATRESLVAFAREALFCTWHLVRSNPRAARALFGMTGEVVDVFGQFTPGRLLGIADDFPDLVTLRAQDFPVFWRTLLGAVQQGTAEEFEHVQVYGVLILAGECFIPPKDH